MGGQFCAHHGVSAQVGAQEHDRQVASGESRNGCGCGCSWPCEVIETLPRDKHGYHGECQWEEGNYALGDPDSARHDIQQESGRRPKRRGGDCSTVHEPNVEDLLAEWERSDSPFFGRTRIIPHTLRAMMAEATSSKIVV